MPTVTKPGDGKYSQPATNVCCGCGSHVVYKPEDIQDILIDPREFRVHRWVECPVCKTRHQATMVWRGAK